MAIIGRNHAVVTSSYLNFKEPLPGKVWLFVHLTTLVAFITD